MAKKTENKNVLSREEFRIFFDDDNNIKKTKRKPGSNSTFEFTDKIIRELPFCHNPIDLFNRTKITDSIGVIENALLVLRLNKSVKTFYLKHKGRNVGKIANWTNNDTNRSHFKDGEANVATAIKRAAVKAREEESKNPEVAHIADLTIRQYLDIQYKTDRTIFKTLNKGIKPVAYSVIKNITSDMTPLINEKLKNIKENWMDILIEYWETGKKHPTQNKICVKAKRSQRKAYTQINSMFNICVKAGYIAKNALDGNMDLFKDIQEDEFQIETIDIDADTALKYIFEKADGSLQGKIMLSSMMLGGFRNCEVYRNYTKNYKIKEKMIFIPAHITHKTNKSRTVPIENDYFWQKVDEYLFSPDYLSHQNEAGHLLPMKKLPSKKRREREGDGPYHSTDSIKGPVWRDFKRHFNLEKHIVPYNFRHTFATNSADELDVHYAADLLGDSITTFTKRYRKIELDRKARPALAKFQSSTSDKSITIPTDYESNAIVLATNSGMPSLVSKLFDIFKNGKVISQENHLLKTDWNKFVALIKAQSDAGKIKGDDLEMWLMMQS
jgi:integrase